jgi:hypothetical protein
MTRTTVFGISFDAHDAARLAKFWADVLGRQVAAARTCTTPLSCQATSSTQDRVWRFIKYQKAKP